VQDRRDHCFDEADESTLHPTDSLNSVPDAASARHHEPYGGATDSRPTSSLTTGFNRRRTAAGPESSTEVTVLNVAA